MGADIQYNFTGTIRVTSQNPSCDIQLWSLGGMTGSCRYMWTAAKFNQSHPRCEVSNMQSKSKQSGEEVCGDFCAVCGANRSSWATGRLIKKKWEMLFFAATSFLIMSKGQSSTVAELFVVVEANKKG